MARLGRLEEAREDVATLLRLTLNATITETRALVPLAPTYMEMFADGLRQAGLPE